jgi:cobalt/nickel transport system permease protein
MHISEGVLSAPVLLAGAALTAAGVAVGLRRMPVEKIPEVAVTTSAFFVAALIHIPVGPANMHMALNGLLGIMLGWMAFPSILVALALQALLFQFGGLSTLGVNTFNMAAPAVMAHYLLSRPVRKGGRLAGTMSGFAAGASGVAIGAVLIALCLLTTDRGFTGIANVLVVSHLPLMLVEGTVTAFIISFLLRVKPEMLEACT